MESMTEVTQQAQLGRVLFIDFRERCLMEALSLGSEVKRPGAPSSPTAAFPHMENKISVLNT